MEYKKLLIFFCTVISVITCCMDNEPQLRRSVYSGTSYSVVISKQEEKPEVAPIRLFQHESKPIDMYVANKSALASKFLGISTSTPIHSYEHVSLAQEYTKECIRETGEICRAKTSIEQTIMIMQLYTSLDVAKEKLTGLNQELSRNIASKDKAYDSVGLERSIANQEYFVEELQKKIDECTAAYQITIQNQLDACHDTTSKNRCITALYDLHNKLHTINAPQELVVTCKLALYDCLESASKDLKAFAIRSMQQTDNCTIDKLDKNIDTYMQHFTGLSFEQKLAAFTNLNVLHNDHEQIIKDMAYIADIYTKTGDTATATLLLQNAESHKMGLIITVIKINRTITVLNAEIQANNQPYMQGQYATLLTKTIREIESQGASAQILEKLQKCRDFCKNEAIRAFRTKLTQKLDSCTDLSAYIKCLFDLKTIRDNLTGQKASTEMLTACTHTLHACIQKIHASLSPHLNQQPTFLEAALLEKLNQTGQSIWKYIDTINLSGSQHDYKAELKILYNDRLFLKNLAQHVNDMTCMGTDFTGISLHKSDKINDAIKTYVQVIDTSINNIKNKTGVYSAAHILGTESCPTFMTSKDDKKIWDIYEQGPRTFVVDHFKPGMLAGDICKACLQSKDFDGKPGQSNIAPEAFYEYLLRHYAVSCQLQHQLEGKLDIGYAIEHSDVFYEVKAVNTHLANMIATLRDEIIHRNPDAHLKDFNDILIDMQQEARYAQWVKQRSLSIGDLVVQMGKTYFGALVQQCIGIDLSTDFTGALKANVGPLQFALNPKKDLSSMNACTKQFNKIQEQQKAVQKPAQIIEGSQTAAASGTSQPAQKTLSMQPIVTTQKVTTPRKEIIANAARLLAHHKLTAEQEAHPLAQAYEPLEPLIMMSDSGKPFKQQEVLFDLVQTMASTHEAGNAAAHAGNTEQAADWHGLTESLGQVYSVLLTEYEHIKPDLPFEARAAIGVAKGAVKGAVGIVYAVCNPKETMQNLEHALNKLDYHAGRLYRNNPEEWAHAHQAIENFKKMPIGDQSEFLGELFGNLYGAPALVGKGVSLGAKLLGEAQILEKANKLVQKFSTGAAWLAKEVFAEEVVVVTPEGVKMPVLMEDNAVKTGVDVKKCNVVEAEQTVRGKSKYWHSSYVNDLSSTQMILGVQNSSKGPTTLGSASQCEAWKAGMAWVGENPKPIYNPSNELIGYSSADKSRTFRLHYKPKDGMLRANFQEFTSVPQRQDTMTEIKNVHIDILD